MALPKIDVPTFTLTIPSTKKELGFRPFLVKEEKILLMAQQGTETDMISAIKQIINNCCLDKLDVDTLATFDLEYLFLKLRGKSVNNIIELKFKDNEDEKVYDFQIDLDKIEVTFPEENNPKIKINDKLGIIMKYPSVNATQSVMNVEDRAEMFNKILVNSVEMIYDDEEVYPVSDHTEEELLEFIDNLDSKTFKKIEKFFENMPRLTHVLEYTNTKGNKRKIELNTVQDFLA